MGRVNKLNGYDKSKAFSQLRTEVGGKSDFVDLKMMMMGTMIPSFLKAAKPFRKYETTAAVAAPQQLRRNAKEPLRWVFIFL